MNNYDLVLLLGGTGSRMKDKPHGNKHLTGVNGKPVVEYIKDKIDNYEAAVQPFENKYVVTNGTGVEEIMRILGQDYQYFYQENPTGIPDAAFIPQPKNPFLLHLGDQFYDEPLGKFMEGFYNSEEAMRVWLKKTKDTNHTVALTDDHMLKRFIEKPNYPDNVEALVATGMYLLKPYVQNYIQGLPRNAKGENDMSELANIVMQNYRVGTMNMEGNWYDVNSLDVLENIK